MFICVLFEPFASENHEHVTYLLWNVYSNLARECVSLIYLLYCYPAVVANDTGLLVQKNCYNNIILQRTQLLNNNLY